MALDPSKPIHLATTPFVAVCGADDPNQQTTTVREYVTCPCCLGNHKWTGRRMGGPPDVADSYEWVGYCEACGIEKVD